MGLDGKKYLVTGGSSGIGRAIAEALLAEGARVSINGRNVERLEAAASEIGCSSIPGDVGSEPEAQSIIERFVAHHDGLDGLINNAGVGTFAPLVEAKLADLEAILRTNVIGAFLMGRATARHLVSHGGGSIVNIASTAGTRGFAGGSAYVASKFALRGMTECWREELRRHDVRVILINPSEVLTDFARRAGAHQEATDKKLRPEDIAHAVVAALTMNERGFIPELSVFATNPF